ncbi:hypothetical protein FRB90_004232 [Tulasnella sp. 427]|nr:hypothetical protein FRB90_004232 [Tulasnella sp. 427]
MKDQVDSLVRRGIPAGRLDSSQSKEEYLETQDALRSGQLKLLYVAPERLNMEGFMSTIGQYDIDLLAVDEAHCCSEWGESFRPDYLKIARFAKEYNAKRVLCLTATATSQVTDDICRVFDIDPTAGLFRAPSYRHNLHLQIETVADDPQGSERIERTIQFCRANPGPTIVYVTQQKNTENVALALQSAGLSARCYHAGMNSEVRKATQEWFMESPTAVVCATIAFGMGIDKADIRNVIHFNLPKTLEGYSQEVGRAGRDGKPSKCLMFAYAGDRCVLENFARGNTPSKESVRKFVARVCIDANVQDVKAGGVLMVNMFQYAKDYDIRDVTLGLLFAQLELRYDLLRSVTPMYMVFEYKTPSIALYNSHVLKDFSPAAKALRSHAKFGRTQYTVDVFDASAASRIDRNVLVAKLNDWHDSGYIELKPSQRRNRYLLLKDMPTDEAEINEIADGMFERMEAREKDEVARLDKVFNWASTATCLPKALGDYFGDIDSLPLDATCSYCTPCRSGGAPAMQYDYTPPPFDEIAFQKVLNATPIRDDARFLARLAFGITSPRITAEKLSKHDAFGIMAPQMWDSLLERCEREVEAFKEAYPDGLPVQQGAKSGGSGTAVKRKEQTASGTSGRGGSSAKRARGGWKK